MKPSSKNEEKQNDVTTTQKELEVIQELSKIYEKKKINLYNILTKKECFKNSESFASILAKMILQCISPNYAQCAICQFEYDTNPILRKKEDINWGYIPHWLDEDINKFTEGYNYSKGEFRFEIVYKKVSLNSKIFNTPKFTGSGLWIICKEHFRCTICESMNLLNKTERISISDINFGKYINCKVKNLCPYPHDKDDKDSKLKNKKRCISNKISSLKYHVCPVLGTIFCSKHKQIAKCCYQDCNEGHCDFCIDEYFRTFKKLETLETSKNK